MYSCGASSAVKIEADFLYAIKQIISYCNDSYASKAGKVENQQNTNKEEEQAQLVELIRFFKSPPHIFALGALKVKILMLIIKIVLIYRMAGTVEFKSWRNSMKWMLQKLQNRVAVSSE